MVSMRPGIYAAAIIIGCACVFSCVKVEKTYSDASRVRFLETYARLRSDCNEMTGLVVPVTESISRKGKWGYDIRIALYKGFHLLGRIHASGELVHTTDGLAYGLSIDSMDILLDDLFILRGSNQNLIEYAYTIAAIGMSEDRQTLEYSLALPGSMGQLEVFYPGEEESIGNIELIAVQRGTLFAPAYALKLADTGVLVELDVPLDRLAALSSKILEVLK